ISSTPRRARGWRLYSRDSHNCKIEPRNPPPPQPACVDCGHGERVFGDMVNTFFWHWRALFWERSMPWKEMCAMSLRREFVTLARKEGSNIRELCRRYGIQPRIGYKWLRRYAAEGDKGLKDRSRRPEHSPCRTPASMEAKIVALRGEHPCWG